MTLNKKNIVFTVDLVDCFRLLKPVKKAFHSQSRCQYTPNGNFLLSIIFTFLSCSTVGTGTGTHDAGLFLKRCKAQHGKFYHIISRL